MLVLEKGKLAGDYVSCLKGSDVVMTKPEDVTLIDPAKTELVFDESPSFIASRLYVESKLRQSALQGDAVVQRSGHLDLGHIGRRFATLANLNV